MIAQNNLAALSHEKVVFSGLNGKLSWRNIWNHRYSIFYFIFIYSKFESEPENKEFKHVFGGVYNLFFFYTLYPATYSRILAL